MGLIYSKCYGTNIPDEIIEIKEPVTATKITENKHIPKNIIKKASIRINSIKSEKDNKEYLNSYTNRKEIMRSNSLVTKTDLNSSFSKVNNNSVDAIVPPMNYGSYDSPSFNFNPNQKKFILESIILDEEERGVDPFTIPEENYSKFSFFEDKHYDPYDNSFESSFLHMEYQNKINDKEYISMSGNSISIDQTRKEITNSEVFDYKNITNLINRQNYLVVYFELHYFMLWGAEYIKTVYPDTNLVIIAQFNDDIRTQEKIYMIKSEEKFKYEAMLKKEDLDNKTYKTIKFIHDENNDNFKNRPIKISIEICTFCYNKLLTISSEEFFFSSNPNTEMHKYMLYPNTYMKYNNKKMGNLNFAFMFKAERLNENYLKDAYSQYLDMFNKKDKLMTFKEDPSLQLNYYDVENVQFKTLTGGNTFLSLKDIQVVEVDSFLKNENVSIDKLLELISLDYISKFEFYTLLKKLHDYLYKKEFNDDKLNLFKEKIFKFLEDMKERNKNLDIIIIPFLFVLVKRTFFKANKQPVAQEKKIIKGKSIDNQKYSQRDIELIVNIFYTSFNYINTKFGPEIALSALNYINKNIDENLPLNFTLEKKKVTSEEFFINFILTKRKYIELCDLLLYLSNDSACALPVTSILAKILKTKKDQTKELVSILKQDRFREVFKEMLKVHDCNSIIMTNTLTILLQILDYIDVDELFQIVDFIKLKDIFCTFKVNGFDLVHDSIISIIKAILVKKSSANNKQSAMTLPLDDNDYCEIVLVFVNAIIAIRTKFIMFPDFNRLIKGLYNLLCHVYTICNIINNINEKNELIAHQVCIDKKMPELLIECLNTLNEKKVFTFIDNGFDKFEINSVNTKMIIFRTLYHCILLIQNLRKIENKIIPKLAAEKFYKVIKILEDNDGIYNPQTIMKNYAKFKGKVDEQFKASVKNLLEYYNRYKQKLPEIADELITILKS